MCGPPTSGSHGHGWGSLVERTTWSFSYNPPNTPFPLSEFKSLRAQDAIEKFQSIVDNNKVCMFLTALDQRPISGRPMAVQEVCDKGNFWFLSSRLSMKDHDIASDPKVQLLFANTPASEFMSIYGTAEEVEDQARKRELWMPLAKAWFPAGVDDPDLTILKITPSEGYYWDTSQGRMITLLKLAAATVIGKRADVGVEGRVTV